MEIVIAGLRAAYKMASGALPMLLLGFLIAGFASVLVPKSLVQDWMGSAAGVRGVLTGTALGILMPGLVTSTLFPFVAFLITMEVGVAPLIAFISAWGLNHLQRLIVWEIPFLGLELALTRFILTIAISPLIALACGAVINLKSK